MGMAVTKKENLNTATNGIFSAVTGKIHFFIIN